MPAPSPRESGVGGVSDTSSCSTTSCESKLAKVKARVASESIASWSWAKSVEGGARKGLDGEVRDEARLREAELVLEVATKGRQICLRELVGDLLCDLLEEAFDERGDAFLLDDAGCEYGFLLCLLRWLCA